MASDLRGLRADLVGASRPRPTASTSAEPTRSGAPTAHSSARMPPIEPPMTEAQRRTPSDVGERRLGRHLVAHRDAREARAVGAAVGARATRARSCPGSRRARWAPRRTSGRCRAARPGRSARPTSRASGCPGPAAPTTWESPVRACSTSTAFDRSCVGRAPGLVRDADGVEPPAQLEGERPRRRRTAGARRVALPPGTAGGRECGATWASCSGVLRGPEAGVEVGEDVLDVLEADREAHQARA